MGSLFCARCLLPWHRGRSGCRALVSSRGHVQTEAEISVPGGHHNQASLGHFSPYTRSGRLARSTVSGAPSAPVQATLTGGRRRLGGSLHFSMGACLPSGHRPEVQSTSGLWPGWLGWVYRGVQGVGAGSSSVEPMLTMPTGHYQDCGNWPGPTTAWDNQPV